MNCFGAFSEATYESLHLFPFARQISLHCAQLCNTIYDDLKHLYKYAYHQN